MRKQFGMSSTLRNVSDSSIISNAKCVGETSKHIAERTTNTEEMANLRGVEYFKKCGAVLSGMSTKQFTAPKHPTLIGVAQKTNSG